MSFRPRLKRGGQAMDRMWAHLCCDDLLACAVMGGPAVRQRVAHELDRRAAGAIVRRILARGRQPAATPAEPQTAGSLVAV